MKTKQLDVMDETFQNIYDRVTVPETGFYRPTNNGGLGTYFIDGDRRYLHFTNPVEKDKADMMKDENLIHDYEPTRNGIEMFIINMMPVLRSGGAFGTEPRRILMTWADFDFTRDQIKMFAVRQEVNATEKKCGLVIAPVFNLCKKILKRA